MKQFKILIGLWYLQLRITVHIWYDWFSWIIILSKEVIIHPEAAYKDSPYHWYLQDVYLPNKNLINCDEFPEVALTLPSYIQKNTRSILWQLTTESKTSNML